MTGIKDKDIYLGEKLKLKRMDNRVVAWSLSPSQYTKEAVKNTERYIKDYLGYRWKITKMAVNPFLYGYEPLLDFFYGTRFSTILLLPIPDWNATVDGGIGTDLHQHRSFDVGITLGAAERGTLGISVKQCLLPSEKV